MRAGCVEGGSQVKGKDAQPSGKKAPPCRDKAILSPLFFVLCEVNEITETNHNFLFR